MTKSITVKLTDDQVSFLFRVLSDTIKDLRDFTDSEQEIAFAVRLRLHLIKSRNQG